MKRSILVCACFGLAYVNVLSAQIQPPPQLNCWVTANPPTAFCCSLVMNTSRHCNSTPFNGGNTSCPDQALSDGEVFRVTRAATGLSTIQSLGTVTCQYQPKRCAGFLQDQCQNDGNPVQSDCQSMSPAGEACGGSGS